MTIRLGQFTFHETHNISRLNKPNLSGWLETYDFYYCNKCSNYFCIGDNCFFVSKQTINWVAAQNLMKCDEYIIKDIIE